jgi:hypothetical protein
VDVRAEVGGVEEGIWVETQWKRDAKGWAKAEEQAERKTDKMAAVAKAVAKGEKYEWSKGRWTGAVVGPKRLGWIIVGRKRMAWREREVKRDGSLGPWGEVKRAARKAEVTKTTTVVKAGPVLTWEQMLEDGEEERRRQHLSLSGEKTDRWMSSTEEERMAKARARRERENAKRSKGSWKKGEGKQAKKKKEQHA